MAAAFKLAAEEDLGDLFNESLTQEVGGHADDVGIVVAAAELRGDFIVDQGGASAFDFVSGDAHADAGAADEDAAVGLALRDQHSNIERAFGIVAAGGFAVSHDLGIETITFKFFGEGSDHDGSSVVCTQDYFHSVTHDLRSLDFGSVTEAGLLLDTRAAPEWSRIISVKRFCIICNNFSAV